MPSQGRRRAGGRDPNIIAFMGMLTLCWISVLVFLFRDDPSYNLAGHSRATELSHAADRMAQQQDIHVQLAEAQTRLRHAKNELAEAKKLAHESMASVAAGEMTSASPSCSQAGVTWAALAFWNTWRYS